MDIVLSFLSGHIFGIQIEGLVNFNLLKFLSQVYVHSTLLTNIRIFMGSTSDNNCAFNSQELAISRPS